MRLNFLCYLRAPDFWSISKLVVWPPLLILIMIMMTIIMMVVAMTTIMMIFHTSC